LLISFATANGQDSHPSRTLAILFHFENPYAHRVLKETEHELGRLMEETSVRLEWHDRSSPQGDTAFSNILVLNFLGTCDPRSDSPFNGPPDSWLARMHVSDGVVLPFGDVNCDLVRTMMRTSEDKPSDNGFGRALARVLAHELYHFITQTTEHATQGLVKPSFSAADLKQGGLRLDRQELSRVSKSMLLQ
jgi:hypothetical protein